MSSVHASEGFSMVGMLGNEAQLRKTFLSLVACIGLGILY